MRFVVTGCNGFIGRPVCRRLAAAGHEVFGIVRPNRPLVPPPPGVRLHSASLDAPAELLPSDLRSEPFTLVHLAWDIASRASFAVQSQQVAILGGLLEHWKSRGLSGVVAAGSADEYGCRSGFLREEDPPGEPVTAYGWGKYAACQLVRNWSLQTGAPVYWLRPFTVYGPDQSGSMLIPYAVQRALAGADAQFTHGRQQRDFVHIDDVADAFAAAALQIADCDLDAETTFGFRAVNLGGGAPVAVRDVLEQIIRLTGTKSHFEFGAVASRPGDPVCQAAVTTAARTWLRWSPRVSLEQGLPQVIAAARKGLSWAA